MKPIESESENIMYRFLRKIKYALPIRPLIVLLILIFLIILPIVCWNLQHSSYFMKGDLNYAAYLKRLANNRRIAAARTYYASKTKKKLLPFDYHSLTSNANPRSDLYPKILILILATNRDIHRVDAYEPKYLSQTLHNILKAIDHDIYKFGKRWSNISISLCNVDAVPERFFEFKQLSRYVEYIQVNTSIIKSSSDVCKTKLHMISCLNLAANRYKNVDKFIVIEDDLISNKDAFTGLASIFNSLEKRFKKKIPSQLAYVQLYYPNHEIKFSFWDSNSWLELLFISSLLVFILYLFYFRLHMRPLFIVYNIILMLILFIICIVCVIAIGRPHWRSGYHRLFNQYTLVESISQSTAAVLMDRQYLNDIIHFQTDKLCSITDSNLNFMELLANENHRRILSTNRNLFKHIGLYSAFKKTIINPHIID